MAMKAVPTWWRLGSRGAPDDARPHHQRLGEGLLVEDQGQAELQGRAGGDGDGDGDGDGGAETEAAARAVLGADGQDAILEARLGVDLQGVPGVGGCCQWARYQFILPPVRSPNPVVPYSCVR
jgi:hypothetical protein